jgi:PAS domain S-box-containing protein
MALASNGLDHAAVASVFDHSSIPMALLDRDRRYVRVNRAALHMFQYTAEDVIGATAAFSARDANPSIGQAQWEQLLRTNELYAERVVEHSSGAPIRISFAAHTTRLDGEWRALVVALSAHVEPGGAELIRTVEPDTSKPPAGPLSPREKEIITRVAFGETTQQIADELFLSRHTVRTHIRNAMFKTSTHTSAQLVAFALTHGLITQ